MTLVPCAAIFQKWHSSFSTVRELQLETGLVGLLLVLKTKDQAKYAKKLNQPSHAYG